MSNNIEDKESDIQLIYDELLNMYKNNISPKNKNSAITIERNEVSIFDTGVTLFDSNTYEIYTQVMLQPYGVELFCRSNKKFSMFTGGSLFNEDEHFQKSLVSNIPNFDIIETLMKITALCFIITSRQKIIARMENPCYDVLKLTMAEILNHE